MFVFFFQFENVTSKTLFALATHIRSFMESHAKYNNKYHKEFEQLNLVKPYN